MKSKLLATLFLAGTSLFAGPRVFFGVGIGAPPPPVVSYVAPRPGPGYTWVAGYWYPVGPRYYWRAGYWARPHYFRGNRYYRGYWRR